MTLLWDALKRGGGVASGKRQDKLFKGRVDPSLFFPATVQLEGCKSSFSPYRQVVTTKSRNSQKFLLDM